MKQYDVRVFSFLMGNSANWPLMRTISESSGGYYTGVSNDDDIIGQILTAKGKIVYESLHDATLKISGVKVLDSTKDMYRKVYRGQQLVMFGRYETGGEAQVSLTARLSGEDKVYSTRFEFPDIETTNPEIERLYALGRIEELETMRNIGAMDAGEAESAMRDLGLNYQLVTDYTSMVVLTDAAFAERGIERRNQKRVAQEIQARTARAQSPIQDWRVDGSQPAFSHPSPSAGGGAVDPITGGIILLGLAGMALGGLRRNGQREG
jgi:Ca-activated chloride channel family protein